MKHFVVTRIGLAIYNEAKLAKAIDLFEAVTLPSLVNQKSQDFVCLIATDAHLPAASRNKLDKLLAGYPNFHVVPIDLTNLVQVHVGCFDWVWDQCQDVILTAGLLDDPRDYVVTSVLDADDGWHRDVVSLVNGFFSQRISKLRSIEKDRTTWVRHSNGMALTFPRGYQWYIVANKLEVLTMEFHSMAVFVTARFSSGISACSSRHSQWREYTKILQFDVAVEAIDRPMWVYTRHNEGVVSWSAAKAMQIDARLENELVNTFGIDMEKIRRWRAAYPVTANAVYLGQRGTGEQYDRIFRIASFNRKLRALKNQMSAGGSDLASLKDELNRCEAERARLIEKLQR
jgi:Putative rhamnosyl transferase